MVFVATMRRWFTPETLRTMVPCAKMQAMKKPQRYRPHAGRTVVAIQLRLDMPGFAYQKWGHDQQCQQGDWLVDNEGDVYTVNAESFARTYRAVSKGLYAKVQCVWATQAEQAGSVSTKEGLTAYQAGDWLVSNQEDGSDSYAVGATKFSTLYELDV
jgi:hypothetical protein